jgi:hypothetical protein
MPTSSSASSRQTTISPVAIPAAPRFQFPVGSSTMSPPVPSALRVPPRPDCTTGGKNLPFGILTGHDSTVGYDLTTGLAVNVANLHRSQHRASLRHRIDHRDESVCRHRQRNRRLQRRPTLPGLLSLSLQVPTKRNYDREAGRETRAGPADAKDALRPTGGFGSDRSPIFLARAAPLQSSTICPRKKRRRSRPFVALCLRRTLCPHPLEGEAMDQPNRRFVATARSTKDFSGNPPVSRYLRLYVDEPREP